MADQFDRASDLEEAARVIAIAKALAAIPSWSSQKLCGHCEEFPRAAGSVNCARCDLELAG